MTKPIVGKTKKIERIGDGLGKVYSFDVFTAQNGKLQAIVPGKGALANDITCDVFERLAHHGVPLAFERRDGDRFITRLANMIPLEIVVRNRATGSALKRDGMLQDGVLIDPPVVEFFYKTTDCKIDGEVIDGLEEDDPLAILQANGELWLYPADRPPVGEPLHVVEPPAHSPDYLEYLLDELRDLALMVNFYLKVAWEQQGGDLWDFKIECGIVDDKLVVADVIDFDSWRVFVNGQPVSKQLFRDKGPIDAVMAAMQLTAKMTGGFQY